MAGLDVPYVQEPSKGPCEDWASQPAQAGLDPVYRLDHLFTLEGTEGGFSQMVLSGTTSYYVTPPADEVYVVERMMVCMRDANFNNASFYGASAALPTGIALSVVDESDVEVHDLTPLRITSWHLWCLYAGADVITVGGANADPLHVRWTFKKAGSSITLDGRLGHRLKFHVPDVLGAGGAGLDEHFALVQGCKLKIPGATV